MSFYPLGFYKNIHHNSGAATRRRAANIRADDVPTTEQSSQILLQKKNVQEISKCELQLFASCCIH